MSLFDGGTLQRYDHIQRPVKNLLTHVRDATDRPYVMVNISFTSLFLVSSQRRPTVTLAMVYSQTTNFRTTPFFFYPITFLPLSLHPAVFSQFTSNPRKYPELTFPGGSDSLGERDAQSEAEGGKECDCLSSERTMVAGHTTADEESEHQECGTDRLRCSTLNSALSSALSHSLSTHIDIAGLVNLSSPLEVTTTGTLSSSSRKQTVAQSSAGTVTMNKIGHTLSFSHFKSFPRLQRNFLADRMRHRDANYDQSQRDVPSLGSAIVLRLGSSLSSDTTSLFLSVTSNPAGSLIFVESVDISSTAQLPSFVLLKTTMEPLPSRLFTDEEKKRFIGKVDGKNAESFASLKATKSTGLLNIADRIKSVMAPAFAEQTIQSMSEKQEVTINCSGGLSVSTNKHLIMDAIAFAFEAGERTSPFASVSAGSLQPMSCSFGTNSPTPLDSSKQQSLAVHRPPLNSWDLHLSGISFTEPSSNKAPTGTLVFISGSSFATQIVPSHSPQINSETDENKFWGFDSSTSVDSSLLIYFVAVWSCVFDETKKDERITPSSITLSIVGETGQRSICVLAGGKFDIENGKLILSSLSFEDPSRLQLDSFLSKIALMRETDEADQDKVENISTVILIVVSISELAKVLLTEQDHR
ncbi:hypothetical protein BLNAU_22237 [Blattamonas nauphoetae]|uniref:Uncharacterized protein n=1 Tax=Blattamonas nauphoetae TaxID=2049346 RepID=A0ABQ9WU58_9EUKA|nr:hypothetical protein BLNAU_22237 [Blattamonas nauphoetae]